MAYFYKKQGGEGFVEEEATRERREEPEAFVDLCSQTPMAEEPSQAREMAAAGPSGLGAVRHGAVMRRGVGGGESPVVGRNTPSLKRRRVRSSSADPQSEEELRSSPQPAEDDPSSASRVCDLRQRAMDSLERLGDTPATSRRKGQKVFPRLTEVNEEFASELGVLADFVAELCCVAEADESANKVRSLEAQLRAFRGELTRVRRELAEVKKAPASCSCQHPPRGGSRGPSGPGGVPGVPGETSGVLGGSAGRGVPGDGGGWTLVSRRKRQVGEAGRTVEILPGVVNAPGGIGGRAAKKARKGGNAQKKGGPQQGPSKGALPQKAGAVRALPAQPASAVPQKKRQGAGQVKPAQRASAAPQKQKRSPRDRVLRPAVLIVATGDRSYAEILRQARENIDLDDYDIQGAGGAGGLIPKRSRGGGFIFEVPGRDAAMKADRLARELEDVIGGDAKVTRPCKYAELRVTGLIDGTTADEVLAALALRGQWAKTGFQVGVIRRGPAGLGTLWVKCPLEVARRITAQKHLRIGMTDTAVQMLEERPLQCYRCLKFGHLVAVCKGPPDLAALCFRCGGAGHTAKECSGELCCLLCRKAGRRHNHRMGGRSCQGAKAAWQKRGGMTAYVTAPGRDKGRGKPPPDKRRTGAPLEAPPRPPSRQVAKPGAPLPPVVEPLSVASSTEEAGPASTQASPSGATQMDFEKELEASNSFLEEEEFEELEEWR